MRGDEVLLGIAGGATERTLGETAWKGVDRGDGEVRTTWTSEKGEVTREAGVENTLRPASDMASIELAVREVALESALSGPITAGVNELAEDAE